MARQIDAAVESAARGVDVLTVVTTPVAYGDGWTNGIIVTVVFRVP